MKYGNTRTSVLSDGIMRVDGGAVFGQVPRVEWEEKSPPDRRNRVAVGLNSLLIQSTGSNILVDTGVGNKEPAEIREAYSLTPSRLHRELRDRELTAKDVHAVILTHLHFDHAGGCTRLDRHGRLVPAFPRAKYYIQKSALEDALKPNERNKHMYHSDDFRILRDSDQLVVLDGEAEVFPGVFVRPTGGHCAGHQMVLAYSGGERVAFLGDAVPTPWHIEMPWISALDQDPEGCLDTKRHLLEQAERDGWLVIFSHGYECKAGYVEQRNGRRRLKPVALD